MSNNTAPAVLTALGLPPIDVWFPCEACLHRHAEHTPACTAADCKCQGYEVALPDGSPRGVRMRQLANLEWSSISPERSLPILLGAVDVNTLSTEEKLKHYEWMRDTVCMALTHVRYWDAATGQAGWHSVRVVPHGTKPNHEAWELSVDELDRGGCHLLAACLGALVADLNDGGPFGGVVRRFRANGASAVPPAGGDVREGATRVGAQSP